MKTRIKSYQRKIVSELVILEGSGTQEDPYQLVTYWLDDNGKAVIENVERKDEKKD